MMRLEAEDMTDFTWQIQDGLLNMRDKVFAV